MKNYLLVLVIVIISCKNEPKQTNKAAEPAIKKDSIVTVDSTLLKEEKKVEMPALDSVKDTAFVRLADYSDDFVYEMKYATTDNFLKAQVYDCGECYVRAITARALLKANKAFMEKGYRIKFFDCYRPHDVQKKMWKIVPNATYVADPAKGSIHNKGGAVDITLTDLEGKELDMGTPFDFFGRKARHAYQNLPEEVLDNRKLLKSTMESFGFGAITSEWWHYNYKPTLNYKIANFTWDCK
ncbi:M15 family metallopeptidase [Galbibacter pacificus]|uniref:D-alanyl-D-alanine dipeptidase n=1 Tax=Galbibacter pacificus TaxID=2996052 RepID=A0ABT6FUV2_9FLAO|nr:M15 family metallopeptidase [Galbibacter pacificus]MDG3583482.1 M15 family metallopeptidase [Galbibacter pacificus]MDG3587041.1 M15 family metallopeptidase [Galbibacter pacificus]